MTNKEDGDASCDSNPRMAALLAVHLVSQILDEAYVIANAALDSGQPWRNLSMFKSLQSHNMTDTNDKTLEAPKADCEVNENKAEMGANVVATSTPQKVTRVGCSDEAEVSQSILIHNDINPFIGQGDQDIETENELANSTSMFINHLFDMSDVERIVMCDDTEITQGTSDTNDFLSDAMNKIMESYVASNMIPVEALEGFPLVPNIEIIEGDMGTAELSRSDESDYSFMADAFAADIKRDVTFYIEENNYSEKANNIMVYQPAVVEEVVEEISTQKDETEVTLSENKENTVSYEDAYATLNRDYDHGSEEDAFPILQDPKTITLQEVELLTGDTSDEELAALELQKEQKPIESVATVSGVSGSRKTSHTLAKRCRMQGARILACFRGWWRRRTPGKRENRGPCALLGPSCPLSPDARRRSSSLWDNRLLRSPPPNRPAIWKFNTVNEVLLNSNRWKDYTFDPQRDDCGEAGEM